MAFSIAQLNPSSNVPAIEPVGLMIEAQNGESLADIDRDEIIPLFREHAVLKFRGFRADNTGFRVFTEKFCDTFHPYLGATHVRDKVDGVKDHLMVPRKWAGLGVSAHCETTYTAAFPKVLWFFGVRPPASGGETVVMDGASVVERLPSETRAFYEQHTINYTQQYKESMWPSYLGSTTPDEVSALFAKLGVEVRIERGEDGLIAYTSFRCSAFRTTRFGKVGFINHILPTIHAERLGGAFATHMRVSLEGGDPIPEEHIENTFDAVESVAQPHAWRPGDVLMIDNTSAMHAARSYFGRREVHLRMTTDPISELGFQR